MGSSNVNIWKLQNTTEWPQFMLQVFAEYFPADSDYEQQLKSLVGQAFHVRNVDYPSLFPAIQKLEYASTNSLERALRDGPQWYFGRGSTERAAIVPSVDFCRKLCGGKSFIAGDLTKCQRKSQPKERRIASIKGFTIIAFLKESVGQTSPIVADYCLAIADNLNPYENINLLQFKSVIQPLRKAKHVQKDAGEYYDEFLRNLATGDSQKTQRPTFLPVEVAVGAVMKIIRGANFLKPRFPSAMLDGRMISRIEKLETSVVSRTHFMTILVDLYLTGSSFNFSRLHNHLKGLSYNVKTNRPAGALPGTTSDGPGHPVSTAQQSIDYPSTTRINYKNGSFPFESGEWFAEATFDANYLGELKTIKTKRVAIKSLVPTSSSRADFLRRCYESATAGINKANESSSSSSSSDGTDP